MRQEPPLLWPQPWESDTVFVMAIWAQVLWAWGWSCNGQAGGGSSPPPKWVRADSTVLTYSLQLTVLIHSPTLFLSVSLLISFFFSPMIPHSHSAAAVCITISLCTCISIYMWVEYLLLKYIWHFLLSEHALQYFHLHFSSRSSLTFSFQRALTASASVLHLLPLITCDLLQVWQNTLRVGFSR